MNDYCKCVMAVTKDEREIHCRNCGDHIHGINVEKSAQSTTTRGGTGGDPGAVG